MYVPLNMLRRMSGLWDNVTGTFSIVNSPRLHFHPAEAWRVQLSVQQHVQVPACAPGSTLTLQLADAITHLIFIRHAMSRRGT